MRLIDADAMAADETEAFMLAQIKVNDEATRLANEVVHRKIQMLISDTPTVEAEPVRHGHWNDKGWLINECSLCGRKEHFTPNYCPNCGAKMDGKEAST